MRAPAGPRRRPTAWGGRRAMHLTAAQTPKSTLAALSAGEERARWRGRAGAAGAVARRMGLDGRHAAVGSIVSQG